MQDPSQGLPEGQPAQAMPDGQVPLPEPTAPAPAQEPTQAQPEGLPDPARHFQSLADQRYAENLRLQKELFDLRMAMNSAPQTQRETPPDPATDWAGYIRWTNRELAREIKEETRKEVMGQFQQMISTAQDAAWQQKHPNVDIQTVRAFAQVRGIRELDDALSLMEMQSSIQQVARQTAQSTLNSFRQPQSQAQPLRNTQAAPPPAQLRYDVLADEYVKTHGRVFDSWPKDIQDAFTRESNLREAARAAGARNH